MSWIYGKQTEGLFLVRIYSYKINKWDLPSSLFSVIRINYCISFGWMNDYLFFFLKLSLNLVSICLG